MFVQFLSCLWQKDHFGPRRKSSWPESEVPCPPWNTPSPLPVALPRFIPCSDFIIIVSACFTSLVELCPSQGQKACFIHICIPPSCLAHGRHVVGVWSALPIFPQATSNHIPTFRGLLPTLQPGGSARNAGQCPLPTGFLWLVQGWPWDSRQDISEPFPGIFLPRKRLLFTLVAKVQR